MKNLKLNSLTFNSFIFKNNQKWDQEDSNRKKAMVNNNLVQDLMFQQTDDGILSIDTLMEYVQGLMPLSEREVFEAEVFKEGNEFYIDAIKGLVKLINKENDDADATMDKLAKRTKEMYPRFLIQKDDELYRNTQSPKTFIGKNNGVNYYNIQERSNLYELLEEQSRLSVEQ